MKCLNPLNNYFVTVWPMGKGVGCGGVSKCAPEPNVAGNLMKCLNTLHIFFHYLAHQRGVVGWWRVSKCASEPKLQEI